jgi:hypothetical protein
VARWLCGIYGSVLEGDAEGLIQGMSFCSLCIQSSLYFMHFPILRKAICLTVIQYNIFMYAQMHFHIVQIRHWGLWDHIKTMLTTVTVQGLLWKCW